MSDAAHWQYGGGPTGQPQPFQDGEYVSPTPRPRLFGEGDRELRGVPRAIQLTQPAVGADWKYTHSGPSWFRLLSLTASLVTSATVATRIVRISLSFRGLTVALFPPAATQAAGLSVVYSGVSTNPVTADPATIIIPLPADQIILDSMTIASSTTALQANDAWFPLGMMIEEFTDRCLDVL